LNFRGSQDVAQLETKYAIKLLQEFTGVRYVNLRPLSGLSGMAMVLSALGGGRGSKVLSVAPQQGGHYATSALAARLGLGTCFIKGFDAHTIDYEGVARTLRDHRPSLIYIDQSNCLFPLDVRQLVEVTRDVAPDTLIHVDVSHWLGLVFGGQIPNPLALGADSLGASTHKSFPGPHKAIVATDREDIWDKLHRAQYEMISSHHFGAAISLAIALLEFKECGGADYASNVVRNAKELGRRLHERGIAVEAADRGFSSGHQLWIRTAPSGVDAYEASDRLYRSGIRVNAFPELPGIPERVIRIGVNEATYHGLEPHDMTELADIFIAAILDAAPVDGLAERVATLRSHHCLPYAFPSGDVRILSRVFRMVSRVMAPRNSYELGDFVNTLSAASEHVLDHFTPWQRQASPSLCPPVE